MLAVTPSLLPALRLGGAFAAGLSVGHLVLPRGPPRSIPGVPGRSPRIASRDADAHVVRRVPRRACYGRHTAGGCGGWTCADPGRRGAADGGPAGGLRSRRRADRRSRDRGRRGARPGGGRRRGGRTGGRHPPRGDPRAPELSPALGAASRNRRREDALRLAPEVRGPRPSGGDPPERRGRLTRL